MSAPIGRLPSGDGWQSLPIVKCREPLVAIGPFSSYTQIATSSIYAGERDDSPYRYGELDGALLTVFVREGVAKKLAEATRLLPSGHMLLVWDGYRTLTVQKALFDYYVDVLKGTGVQHDQAIVDAQKFVSAPSEDSTRPPPHHTGGALDLTIVRVPEELRKEMDDLNLIAAMPQTLQNWEQVHGVEIRRMEIIHTISKPLDMGTVFNEVRNETETRYYEKLDQRRLGERDKLRRDNRRLLHNVMARIGSAQHDQEWWHHDFDNQRHAACTGRKAAIYGVAALSPENEAHELMRRALYAANPLLHSRSAHPKAAKL